MDDLGADAGRPVSLRRAGSPVFDFDAHLYFGSIGCTESASLGMALHTKRCGLFGAVQGSIVHLLLAVVKWYSFGCFESSSFRSKARPFRKLSARARLAASTLIKSRSCTSQDFLACVGLLVLSPL